MPRRAQVTLSKRTVDALRVKGDDAVFWDRDLPGFGVRVYPSGRRIFVVQCRGPAGIRRVSLGPYGELSCEQARSRARAAIDRIKRGEQARAPAPEPAFDGHRVPADRGAHAAMGRRRPQGGGAAVARFQRYRRWRATRIWQAIRCGNRRPGWPGASARICGLAHRRRRLAGAERGPGTAARTRRRKHGCAGGRDRSLPIGASMWSISARSGWNPCGISRLWPQAFRPRASCIARGGMVGYAHLAPGGVGSSRA